MVSGAAPRLGELGRGSPVPESEVSELRMRPFPASEVSGWCCTHVHRAYLIFGCVSIVVWIIWVVRFVVNPPPCESEAPWCALDSVLALGVLSFRFPVIAFGQHYVVPIPLLPPQSLQLLGPVEIFSCFVKKRRACGYARLTF